MKDTRLNNKYFLFSKIPFGSNVHIWSQCPLDHLIPTVTLCLQYMIQCLLSVKLLERFGYFSFPFSPKETAPFTLQYHSSSIFLFAEYGPQPT